MQVTVRVLGFELLHVDLSDSDEATAESVEGAELAGGTLVAERVADGGCDTVMGFTNGRESGDE